MNELVHTRIRKLASVLIGVLAAGGILYALWAIGRPVPCLFRWLTGLRCPGCGVTHMCVALLHGQWAAAWQANPCLLLLSPLLGYLLARMAAGYLKSGHQRLNKRDERIALALVVVLIAWGIFRNLFGY